jgi:protocatechuate 3,4-dioxygenase beta subunit
VKHAAIVLLAVAAGCGGSGADRPERSDRAAAERVCKPTPGGGSKVTPAPGGAARTVRLGPGMELKATERNLAAARDGEALVVTGTVRGEDCAALAGATVHAWQTNGDGRYGPRRGGRDVCCYLAGTVRTGEDGRYRLDTVMPRGYDGGPAHIHMQIGHEDSAGLETELLFGVEPTSYAAAVVAEESSDGRVELDIVLPGS